MDYNKVFATLRERVQKIFATQEPEDNKIVTYETEKEIGEDLAHYGTPRHSGRYPWGSGEKYQRSKTLLSNIKELSDKGYSETDIAKALGYKSVGELRQIKSNAKAEKRAGDRAQAIKWHDKGMSNEAIGMRLGMPESSVRNLYKDAMTERANKTANIANTLKEQVALKTYLDVGAGVERQLGISKEKLKNATKMLEEEGYKVQNIYLPQATNRNQKTTVKVLAKDDVTKKDLYDNREKIRSIDGVYFEDDGKTTRNIEPPQSIDSKRIQIKYNEEGGINKDGLIEIRPGVEDLSLGKNKYCQVRIAVDGSHYMKGMAVYNTDLPDGIDVRFNTNKHVGTDKMKVLKEMKTDKTTGEVDEENPFGSTVRQSHYKGADGKDHLSAINIVNDDTDWTKWSKNLASQFLSKQNPKLAQQQLKLTYDEKELEFKEIMKITNPTVKKQMLETFAQDCDSSAVNLKAAPLPRQATHVLLPMDSIKPNEIYAPNYENGEQVALVRYPHQGTFEIPVLTVNNKNAEARNIIGNAEKAVGIHHTAAEQLSGADFDGDTAIVIPLRSTSIKLRTSEDLKGKTGFEALEGLKTFDPKEVYKAYEGMPRVGEGDGFHKGTEMGKISNLITDMTIKGATPEEIARATRHSLCVIDAEKHNLNWKQCEADNGIKQLKEKYQGAANAGASTIISRAKGDLRVPERREIGKFDPETGEVLYRETGRTYTKTMTRKDGTTYTVEKPYQSKIAKMAGAKDAYDLVSPEAFPIERIYADHANRLKALANTARKEYLAVKELDRNPEAARKYAAEVSSLNANLDRALKNAPRERLAQLIASKNIELAKEANPDLRDKEHKEDLAKVSQQCISAARDRVGAKKSDVEIYISDREWEAIQAGAITKTKLKQILDNANSERVRELATPKYKAGMSTAQVSRAKSLLKRGYTQKEVADQLGVSVSTLFRNIS